MTETSDDRFKVDQPQVRDVLATVPDEIPRELDHQDGRPLLIELTDGDRVVFLVSSMVDGAWEALINDLERVQAGNRTMIMIDTHLVDTVLILRAGATVGAEVSRPAGES